MQFKLLVHPVPFQFPGRHEDLAAYDQFTAKSKGLELGETVWSFERKKKKIIAYSIIFFMTKMIRKQWVLNVYKYIFLKIDSITE